DLPAWEERVRRELGTGALLALVELLEIGSPGEQYGAMAAARILGAEVWATDREPNLAWTVTFPPRCAEWLGQPASERRTSWMVTARACAISMRRAKLTPP